VIKLLNKDNKISLSKTLNLTLLKKIQTIIRASNERNAFQLRLYRTNMRYIILKEEASQQNKVEQVLRLKEFLVEPQELEDSNLSAEDFSESSGQNHLNHSLVSKNTSLDVRNNCR